MNCNNCQHDLKDNAQYCSSCGQSTTSLNRPFFMVSREWMHELLDIDGKLWLSLKTLLTKPGRLTQEFNQGKRVKYTPPLRLYLAISIIFFVVFSKIYQVYDPNLTLTESTISYYSKAMFILFPIFALIIQLFFRQSYFIGNLVFSMHIHCIVYLLLMIIAPLESIEQKHLVFLLLQIPPVLYGAWYLCRAFKTVFQQSWSMTIGKAAAIYMIYMAILGIFFDIVMLQIL